MLTDEQQKRAAGIIGSSASDCEVSMVLSAGHSPVRTLSEVAETLYYMNVRGLEKKSHRQALMKAGRAALKKLGDM